MAGQDHQGDDLLDLNSLLGSQGDSASSSSVLNGNQDIGESSENKSTTEQTPDVLQASSELHHSRTQPNHPDHSYSSEKENHSSEDTGQPEEHRKYNPARAIRDKNSHAELSSNWRNTGKEQFSGCKPKDYSFETRKKSVPNLVLEESNNYSFVESSVINKERQLWKERELNSVEMTSMAKLEPSEIVMKLAAPGSGLKKLLNESSIDLQLLESLLAVLNKAIGCTTNRQNLIHLLNEVHGSLFLMQVLPSCILQYITTHQNTFPLIDHTLVLLSELVSIFPCSSFTEVTIVKTLLEKAVDEAQTNGKTFPEETQQKLVTLNDALQHSQKEKQEGRLRSDNNIYMIGNKGNIEDEDFRSLSIFPTYNDIYTDQKPHMRLNIISRSYPDAKSYLDTHFRLLREDFIRPLRDGISQLLTLESKNLAESKFDDIRIYFDTKILYPLCTRAGIVHQVKFSMSNLKQVTWEISRRLLYGALVCLSKDNFQNMLFATVADRSVTDLQNGIITLMFTEESRQKLAEHTLEADTFLMVETMAYFEAYCHVLEGLKEMVDSEIPFQNYIVHCDTTMSAPVYLGKNHSNYSLERSIKKQSPTQKQISSSNPTWSTVTPIQQEITSSEEDTETTPKFDVLDFMTWPTKEELELDSSQFEAFQMALTSELSIVQGPPGTGKTYVGIKIVDALLNNSEIWKQGHNPILVVCYTNHALDQFLEGIYRYEKKNIEIVRVGSRSSSAILQRCTLSNIRSCRSFARGSQYMTLLSERDRIQEEMNDKSTCLQNAFKGVIHESFLEEHMHPFDFASFTMAKECKVTRYGLRRRSSIIAQWLGVSGEQSGDCSFAQRGECADLEDEAMEDSIKVIEEPEIAQSERMTGEYDINNQLRHVCERAAEKQHDIFVFMLTQQDKVDEKNDKDGVWQISKEMKRKLKNQIKRELEKKHYMDEVEYEQISNFWDLSISKRWEIYRLWRNQLITNIRVQISELENEYQEVINRLIELRNQEDHLILQKADVIGMTTTGAAKYRKILQKVRPKIVVVEEAAEVLEAHIITTLSSNCQHLILIGDHQQLRPTTTVYELAKNFNLDVSMFERLIRMDVPHVRLNYQHRMRPEIARLLTPHIYDNLENHESVYEYDNIKGVGDNIFFVDHNHLEEHIHEGKSHQNIHEAAFVRCLCLYFIHQGYDPSQITVLTTYTGQLHCLQKMMPKSKFEGVRLCVVDKYQGEENEIIILSLVRSNLEGQVGFLKIPNRVCVALSRAKRGLFCIGNMQMLSNIPLWSKINDVLKANGQIGRELKLQCENHPNTLSYVSTSEDFSNVPEGGCTIPCEYRLNCGHVCTLLCHPYDPEHKKFICNKPCPKVMCINGHKCTKKCSEPCGKCEVLVPKKIPTCGHIQDVQCSMSPRTFTCKEPCTKTLYCGHQCFKSCGERCFQSCPEKLTVELKCGHTIKTLCHLKSEAKRKGHMLECDVKCQEKLTCGHPCLGPCSICSEQGSHMDCAKQCDIVLWCSHHCEEKCSTDCFCSTCVCEKKCFHDKCSHKCNDPCAPCTKPCAWRCIHEKCTKRCWESCNRKPCDKPCRYKLNCGHLCIGLCGEPCPTQCRKCDADEVTELFFGKEADPEARFVQLMDCPHIFEVTEFSKWMNQKEEDQVIKLKSCPKCSKAIRQSLRYGDLIKQTLSDIETVKERIVCNWLNQLEVFLNENEAVLRHFPAASQAIKAVSVTSKNITIPSLMLVSEKLKLWLKIGIIKNKLQQLPNIQRKMNNDIDILCRGVQNAISKTDVLKKHYELLKMALNVEYVWLKETSPDLPVDDIVELIIRMKYLHPDKLEHLRAKIKTNPIQIKLLTLTDNKKSILNNAMLRQDHWHRCPAGHIYTTREDETKPACLQCNHDIL